MQKSQFNEINKTIKLYMLRQEYERCLRGTKIHENIYIINVLKVIKCGIIFLKSIVNYFMRLNDKINIKLICIIYFI